MSLLEIHIYACIVHIIIKDMCSQSSPLGFRPFGCMRHLYVQLISLNQNQVNRNFRKWVGCEALAPIQDNGSL